MLTGFRLDWYNNDDDVSPIIYKELYLNVFSVSLLISDRTHWPDADNPLFTLEATGYALLALLKGGHVKEAAAPFKWLNQQREVGGGYGSTQVSITNEFYCHIWLSFPAARFFCISVEVIT